MNHTKGFTLIEAMIVIAILAILAATAYPSFQSNIASTERRKTASAIENALNLTRIAAIESNKRTVIRPTSASDWKGELIIFEDDNANGTFDSGEKQIQRINAQPDNIDVTLNGTMQWMGFIGGGTKGIFSNGVPASLAVTYSGHSGKICLRFNQLGRVVRDEKCS